MLIPDEKINTVLELAALHFSDGFISRRVGLARDTVKAIRTGKRKPKRDRKEYNEPRVRDPETIKREAQEALVQSGRLNVKLLDHNPIWS